ncbi:pentatricopeptide repeat-containing protein At4g14820 [Phoenix dactylifera]|uniref:Pentatricopeptide repeat-containing protein At4g14820 n=1 Tax=Phoenix dactylifera TaxID=42345 RepID=A0A8B7CRL5_PHODC|nr:pentatricopeptide repeat-containing protein At4g14820 [Phoenix dactylifera]
MEAVAPPQPILTSFLSPPRPNHLLLTATTLSHLKQIHAHLLRSGLDLSAPFLSKLLSLPLSSPSSLDYALSVFLHTPQPDARLCDRALRVLSRASAGDYRRALAAYDRIRRAGLPLDRFSFPTVLRVAARAGADDWVAREAHGLVAKLGFDSDPFVQTALVRSYAACGRVADARGVFDRMSQRDLVAWGVMLDGYCQTGCFGEALQLFEDMKSCNVVPDQVILATVLSACGRTGNLMAGQAIHSYIVASNISMDSHLQSALINMYSSCKSMDNAQKLYDSIYPKNLVSSTAMVFGYAKIGKIEIAHSIFDQMPERDLVSWSAMISGYAESDQPNEAIKLFNEMQLSGVRPDRITMLSVISACAHLGALDQAKWVHIFVDKNGFSGILSIKNALIDMYCKCGSLADAQKIFEEMPSRNVITWTSMITGCAVHGDGRSALALFDQMKAEGVEPNRVTFVGLLYACSHTGLVEDGRRIFNSMIQDHNMEPKHEHYGCMVDLLGRARLLQEAFELIESMPFTPNVVVWGSLLGACKMHGDVELGELAAKRLLELDPSHDGAYVLLSNIYAKASRWDDVRQVRTLMKCKGVSKERGCSWIELDGKVHEFLMGDESHPRSSEIYGKLEEVVRELELVGYSPDIGSVLVDLEEEEKKGAVLWHSEKLALSFGLMNSSRGFCIRIAKNLRVCEDCHTFMKLVSKVYEREIVLRDRSRFHHYKDGVCSCRDFW